MTFPAGTSLLVYTDEERFKTFSFGAAREPVEKSEDFAAVAQDLEHLLLGFSEVFVYSRDRIHSAFKPTDK